MPAMASLLDKIVAVDVESTCWEGNPPPGQVSEVIQVGVCTVDTKSLERAEKRSILVKPVRSEASAATSWAVMSASMLALAWAMY
jgi:hypothetical protein